MRILALLALLLPTFAFAGEAFLAEIEDVPLAPGLTEAQGGLVFDSPTGRIVEASASGALTVQTVLSFYGETLPQLGWVRVSETQFRRDNEILKITTKAGKNQLVVHFNLTPQSGS